jgi:hypothetical protein
MDWLFSARFASPRELFFNFDFPMQQRIEIGVALIILLNIQEYLLTSR